MKETDSTTAAAGAVGLVLFLVILAIQITWGGYALYVLWGWFIVPIFSLPALSVPGAIGVRLVARLLNGGGGSSNNDSALKSIFLGLLGPLLLIVIGWIVKTFV